MYGIIGWQMQKFSLKESFKSQIENMSKMPNKIERAHVQIHIVVINKIQGKFT